MTTFEHTMLGVNGVLAAGLHRRHGWQIAAMAGCAAASPDWDGLPLVVSASVFAEAHRLWGHNLLACVLVGWTIGILDYRFDLVTRCARLLVSLLRLHVSQSKLQVRQTYTAKAQATWMLVAVVAALSQLPADMVVSGTATLSDWELQPLWPFSHRGWVFAMVPWGDVGITLVFVAGMFAMVRWRSSIRFIASATLLCVVGYIAARGLVAG